MMLMAAPAFAQSPDVEMDAPAATTTHENQELEIKVGLRVYKLQDPSAGSVERAHFEQLSAQERDVFIHNRAVFLSQAARALQVMKYGFGIGSLVKEKIKFGLRSWRDDRAMKSILELDTTGQKDALAARDRTLEQRALEAEELARLTLKSRSENMIQGFLTALDRKLWFQALLFAHSNEFGIMASAGVELLAGTENRGRGGLFDIGISIGYNRDTRAIAIQVFRDIERFQSTTIQAVFVAGVLGKAGMYLSNQRPGEMARKGISFYPPMVPAYTAVMPSQFQTGISSGLTWPPSPLGDLLTYTNSLDNKVLIRITVSPMLKGFVRIETGFGMDTFRFLISPVEKAINSLRTRVFGSRLCGPVFLH
jgi:hypothetical protein